MSYSNADKVVYNFGLVDFGATSGPYVFHIQGPVGRAGILRNIAVDVEEIFECDTAAPHVQVGTSGDADAYGKLIIPDDTADETVFDKRDDTDAIISANIPANEVVYVTCTEGTDAQGVTGQGYVTVEIDWM